MEKKALNSDLDLINERLGDMPSRDEVSKVRYDLFN
jgi:hypothetical protein